MKPTPKNFRSGLIGTPDNHRLYRRRELSQFLLDAAEGSHAMFWRVKSGARPQELWIKRGEDWVPWNGKPENQPPPPRFPAGRPKAEGSWVWVPGELLEEVRAIVGVDLPPC